MADGVVEQALARNRGTTRPGRRILERLERAGHPRAHVLTAFARAGLRRVPHDQLEAADPDATAQQLVEAFAFADARAPGEIAIRVFTPEVALDGWSEPGTVVEVNTEDRPFQLSTITAELAFRGLAVVRSLHPIFGVERDAEGRLERILPARDADHRESFVHIEVDAELDAAARRDLEKTLASHLRDVVAATDDFHVMGARVTAEAARLRAEADRRPDPMAAREVADLLEWLLDGNFVLLGTREYAIKALDPDGRGSERAVTVAAGTGTGILRDESTSRLASPLPLADLPEEQRRRLLRSDPVTISRTNRLSTVHRRARMEYIGVKRFDDGEVTGEFRLLGLFTRQGYSEPARTTPLLRRKLRRILEREDVVPGSHDEATIIALFQALPKDELFQADEDALHLTIMGLLRAEEQQDVTVTSRVDRFTRTVSVVVAVPRDRYGPELRRRFTDILLERFGGTHVDVDLSLGDRADALARFSVHVPTMAIPEVADEELAAEVRALTRTWLDDVSEELHRRRGDAEASRLLRTHARRLPRSYRDTTPPRRAVEDVLALDRLVASGHDLAVVLRPTPADDRHVRLQALRAGGSIELSSFLPILESLGLVVAEEIPHELEGPGAPLFLHDFGVRDRRGEPIDPTADGDRLADAVLAAWRSDLEVDSLNRLVLFAGLSWRQVTILRAYRRYGRQIGTTYTTEYINETLQRHPATVRALLDYFEGRFEPDAGLDDDDLEALRRRVHEQCDAIERLDHDRILRGFGRLVEATVRTNAYRPDAVGARADGTTAPYLALKFDSAAVPDLPKPVPYREIFVSSPLVEGIHLRGGRVARGGIRWSDRHDDVRTEVLGLMKAQMLKNAVIVPTGAKGGFVVKDPPADPGELRAEVQRQYVTFVRALLDVTDNLVGGTVVPPRLVRRHDDDDPYLVVAADKGTATFSDTANAVAEEYGYWLGDAFASGGSNGYDHKALGITARGAWVAVRRHFRELGVDTQSERITVVGIGDMSGDVFGNGMLSSRTLALVGAFDHRDIFLDPDPDPEASFEERRRLFAMPRSTWQDYDRSLISAGGGIFSRGAKHLRLSEQVRTLLRLDDEVVTPARLIRALLSAPVDLLFAGGIGTYVKASSESHADIGDRANDEVRVDAPDLRARVFGEGANLSITQRARIQYARRGGRVNQDAIDNAGGVDCSDHEVNVKILLRVACEHDRIEDSERDRLLRAVTDDVVDHVLADVDRQTFRLTQEVAASPRLMDAYEQLMVQLEATSSLDRAVEALPTSSEMHSRAEAGAGLTRPELGTLLGFAKRLLANQVTGTGLPDQGVFEVAARGYFPELLVERFGDLVSRHRLRRELVAMVIANDVVDRMGITFPLRLAQETGADIEYVLAAYWTAREVCGADRAWRAVAKLDHLLGSERQLALKAEIDRMVAELARRYVADPVMPDVEAAVARDGALFATLEGTLMSLGTSAQRNRRLERAQRLVDDLVDEKTAVYLAETRDLAMAPDVATVARRLGRRDTDAAAAIASTFLRLSTELAIDRLRRVLRRFEPEERWARWQHGGLQADLRQVWTDAVVRALDEGAGGSGEEAVARFLERRSVPLERTLELVADLESEEQPSLDAVAVATRALREAVGGAA